MTCSSVVMFGAGSGSGGAGAVGDVGMGDDFNFIEIYGYAEKVKQGRV